MEPRSKNQEDCDKTILARNLLEFHTHPAGLVTAEIFDLLSVLAALWHAQVRIDVLKEMQVLVPETGLVEMP